MGRIFQYFFYYCPRKIIITRNHLLGTGHDGKAIEPEAREVDRGEQAGVTSAGNPPIRAASSEWRGQGVCVFVVGAVSGAGHAALPLPRTVDPQRGDRLFPGPYPSAHTPAPGGPATSHTWRRALPLP